MPKKLKLHIIVSLGFLGMFYEASDFVEFWQRFAEQSYGLIVLVSPLNYFWKVCTSCILKNFSKPERLRDFYFESQSLLWTVMEDTKMLWLFSSKYPPSAFKGFRFFH